MGRVFPEKDFQLFIYSQQTNFRNLFHFFHIILHTLEIRMIFFKDEDTTQYSIEYLQYTRHGTLDDYKIIWAGHNNTHRDRGDYWILFNITVGWMDPRL